MEHYLHLLRCPITHQPLELVDAAQFSQYDLPEQFKGFGALQQGLINQDQQYFYPVFNEIVVLHQQYATFIGKGEDLRKALSFDKERVFDYYNEVNYQVKGTYNIYGDSAKWVDFRPVSKEYISHSLGSAAKHYPPQGKYFLDIASGPIGYPEYLQLSEGYEYRICIDIAINALLQAKMNLEKAGKKGIYICGDITNIPLQDGQCDTVLSQHTVYHIPKEEQRTAVLELYRVAKPGGKVVVVYCWFYRSWFMNLTLGPIQVYRVARHFAGKLYVRLARSKPRLYFYPHSVGWFRRSFPFSDRISFHAWRSTNKYFMDWYIHRWLGGKAILGLLMRWEDKYSEFWGKFGEYGAVVIEK